MRRDAMKSRSEEMREQQWSGDKRGGEAVEREAGEEEEGRLLWGVIKAMNPARH